MLLLFIVIFSVVSPDPEAALSIILSIVLFSIMQDVFDFFGVDNIVMFPIEEFPIVTIPDVCTVFNVLFNKIVFVIRFVLPVTVLLIIVLLDDGEK